MRYRDRGLLIGQTRSGKSTLAKHLLESYHKTMTEETRGKRDWKPPRILVLDTKPRWRGTRSLTGRNPQHLYRRMVPGDVLDAAILSRPQDWRLAWDRELNPSGIVIVQNLDLKGRQKVRFQVAALEQFLSSQYWKEPSLMYVDEGHDFFGQNATAFYGTAIQECYRAGAEQGMSSLLGIQRPKTVNLQTLTECNLAYLFYIKFRTDLKRLGEMGMTVEQTPEEESYRFLFFRDGKLYPKEVKLRLKGR